MLGAEFLRHEDGGQRRREQSGAIDGAVYQTLVESTRAIPWRIDWATLSFTYIGPQIEDLLGWQPAEWRTVQDWVSRMHPDDAQPVMDFCVAQSQAGVDHEADYRALTKGGEYVWIRDVVHVIRDADGGVQALVGFMFDITERKRVEAQVQALQKQLEAWSWQDGLTGIGNRRRFDDLLKQHWHRATETMLPLSMILLDIDHFKGYNDFYGHSRGDDCLKQVAGRLNALMGPDDTLCRFGGEEFAILMPNTGLDDAVAFANICRLAIADAAIDHEVSTLHRVVTASFGVGSVIPTAEMTTTAFVDFVDAQLYTAKKCGRNRVSGAGLKQIPLDTLLRQAATDAL